MMADPLTGDGAGVLPGATALGLPAWAEQLREFWPGPVLWNCPLSRFSTLKVGGPAQGVIMPSELAGLVRLVGGLHRCRIPWRVIGRGSNILVPDQGVAGVVIVLGREFGGIREVAEDERGVLLEVEAGCGLARLVGWAVRRGLGGLEFAAGIPGSVGGAVVMNAGAHGADMGGVVEEIGLLDATGGLRRINRRDCRFLYRNLRVESKEFAGPVRFGGSGGQARRQVVVSAGLRLARGDRASLERRIRELLAQRKARQPAGVASAGSFFKNPPEGAAGRLIEAAGLKGCRVGGAEVSRRHANFIVNRGGATAADLLELMGLVRERVWARTGIMLEPEVDIWEAGESTAH